MGFLRPGIACRLRLLPRNKHHAEDVNHNLFAKSLRSDFQRKNAVCIKRGNCRGSSASGLASDYRAPSMEWQLQLSNRWRPGTMHSGKIAPSDGRPIVYVPDLRISGRRNHQRCFLFDEGPPLDKVFP
jgi:hypothetical protein